MKFTQHDNVFMGLGRTDKKGMTAFGCRTLRLSLGLTQKGLGELIGADISLVRTYENETIDDGKKVSETHAAHMRSVAQMPDKKRREFIKVSGCTMSRNTKFK
ncbi:helix-turn-helix domain-containing protein [Candidatus Babeliales bacterium]|nr:helix-turn-helix domain-containing protein [Candidatus Babeliales bacterium]